MIARLIELCARNRLAVLAGVAVAAAAGLWSIRHVRLDALPDLSDPQVIVYTEWMGHSPTLVEDQVTYPIVSALTGAPRVAGVRGYSMLGMSLVHVIFDEGTDLYWARSRVQELLATAREELPEGARPALGPDASGTGWAFQYTLVDEGGRHGLDELRAFQDFTLRRALGQVPGVAEVASVGGYERQFQVILDPTRLRAHDVTLQEVIQKIRDSTGEVSGRVLEHAGREYTVRGRGLVQDLGTLEQVVVSPHGGAPVRVKDLGAVRFGPDLRRGLLEWNGDGEAVGGIVVVRTGASVPEVVAAVKRRLADLSRTIPEGVRVEIAYDRTDLIHRAVGTLRRALVEEALVVAAVVVLFLLHVRSALLPVLSLPVAVALSFIPMVALDLPATIMSLGGFAIALGATIDAEIVMVEASHKKLERAPPGADRRALLAEAAREVTPAIFFSLLIVAVAFLPVFTLTGQAGRLFRPLAYTKTFVMLASALLSVTFAPALRDLLLRGKIRDEAHHPVSQAILRVYRPFVFVALRRPRSTLAIGLLAVLSAVPLALRLGTEFMPPLAEGDVLYMPTTLPNLSIDEARRQVQLQDRILRGFPEVASVAGKAGRAATATDPAPLTMVETLVRLRPEAAWRRLPVPRFYAGWPGWAQRLVRPLWPDTRRITLEELTQEMDRALRLPGWTSAFTMPIKARVDMLSTGVRTPVGVKILGADLAAIERTGLALEALLRAVPGTRSALYERSEGGLYLDVVPDPAALARVGLTSGDVQRTIEAAVGGAPIAAVLEGRQRFSVAVRFPEDLRGDVDALRRLPVLVEPAGGATAGEGLPTPASAGPASGSMGGMGGTAPTPSAGVVGGGGPRPGTLAEPGPIAWQSGAAGPGLGADRGRRLRAVPLGQLADVRIVGGPPMLRDEGGLLVGTVYLDVDPSRDLGGYVAEARRTVDAALAAGTVPLAEGSFLRWTGQYEELERTAARLRLAVPAALLLILFLLYLHFRNLAEVLVVLLSIPFALVGSVWALWLLDYRLSTAVWVGLIALCGLAAQTGVVMIVYIDHAYRRRQEAGKIRDLSDIVWAHMEGTVQRVRPKLMTVATMLAGLLPLLWGTGSGADVMKRIAAPMVGGLLTSAFLTLELIPVVYTYWRQEQLLWERLAPLAPARLAALRRFGRVQAAGWAALAAVLASLAYVDVPRAAWVALVALALGTAVVGAAAYLRLRPAARRLVWPAARGEVRRAA
jgi:Cu(I)/Ag(I) efflux system membrane protein CusA/SilA